MDQITSKDLLVCAVAIIAAVIGAFVSGLYSYLTQLRLGVVGLRQSLFSRLIDIRASLETNAEAMFNAEILLRTIGAASRASQQAEGESAKEDIRICSLRASDAAGRFTHDCETLVAFLPFMLHYFDAPASVWGHMASLSDLPTPQAPDAPPGSPPEEWSSRTREQLRAAYQEKYAAPLDAITDYLQWRLVHDRKCWAKRLFSSEYSPGDREST